jgi:hypothetical protein
MKRMILLCTSSLMLWPTAALAHANRTVGPLEFTVGWAAEPAFAGQPNAVELNIERGGEPVEGAEDSLKVRVGLGGEETEALDLRTVFESPGEYRADLIPTAPGGYTFHFTGTVGTQRIDQSFTSPKDGFDEVTGTSEIAFPNAAPSTTELSQRIVALEGDVEDARSATTLPLVLAIVALVFAVIAFVFGMRGRSRA